MPISPMGRFYESLGATKIRNQSDFTPPDTHAKIDSQEKLAQIYKNPQINSEVREKSERDRRIKSLRLATEEVGKQVQHGLYVSKDELRKAQAQQTYLGYGNTHE